MRHAPPPPPPRQTSGGSASGGSASGESAASGRRPPLPRLGNSSSDSMTATTTTTASTSLDSPPLRMATSATAIETIPESRHLDSGDATMATDAAAEKMTLSKLVGLPSTMSVDYDDDDAFELPNDHHDSLDDEERAREIGLLEETLGFASPIARHSKSNGAATAAATANCSRRSSLFGATRPLTLDDSDDPTTSARDLPPQSPAAVSVGPLTQRLSLHQRRAQLRLRRKDLELEQNAAHLVAVLERPPAAAASNSPICAHAQPLLLPAPSPSSLEIPTPPSTSTSVSSNATPLVAPTTTTTTIGGDETTTLTPRTIRATLTLSLQMKLKVSDRPLKCIALTRCDDRAD